MPPGQSTQSPTTRRDPSMGAIIQQSYGWWKGIASGSIKFVEAHSLIKDYIPAYIPGHMIVVGGYTSAGKSQFLNQIVAWAAGVKNAPTIVFSNEDSRMEKMFGLVSCITETVHRKDMILGKLNGNRDVVKTALDNIKEWPLSIYDDVRFLHDMASIIKEKKPRIVVLDYVQKVRCAGKIYDRMAEAAHTIFDLAQDFGVTFFVASQVSVGAAAQENPNVINLKGAGDLAEAAHAVVNIKKGRKDDDKHLVKIEIKKNKAFGPIGTVLCKFNNHWTLIEKRSEMDTIGE